MRTIIFIDSYKSGSSREAIRAADQLGYFTVLFTQRQSLMSDRANFPDIHEMVYIDLDDKEAMREKIKDLQTDGKLIHTIVSFINSNVYTAALLCEEFCGKRLSTDAIFKMENKIESRQTLQEAPFNIPFAVYEEGMELFSLLKQFNLHFPIIIKPPCSTGSKDVLKAENKLELDKYIKKFSDKYPGRSILLEEYIEASQYLVEALVYQNEVNIVAILEQEITKDPPFIITGYSLLAKVPDDLYESISKAVRSIIRKFGMENGACHLELRLYNNQWKLIEINPRISGTAMNRMIEEAYGINLAQQILKIALGEKPTLKKKYEKFVFTQHIILPAEGILQKVTGKNKALNYEGVREVYIKPKKGKYVHPPWSMGHRYAYVMAASLTKEEAKRIAKTAAKEIQFHLIS
ncbi:ATP-grasp domain-containing protein [Paenactinomyces guangxiensis]|uniref:ATP-grasp domain-containing protein n=1 Tax=Paenactinomyces guangxiensis TaxID=1490290 RepID=A0A7W2AAJ4_9BACL|nr:ATP-grasp domain-containing protein [Paenactinomyces guangxiensis]MBA4496264.1 ATP-grasp domain-containing protein [Paenactinomyces guangxiensis]MBH8593354.1 ATP-grasp domain-containing protein [Paenactinomyces guangxiensis]